MGVPVVAILELWVPIAWPCRYWVKVLMSRKSMV